MALFDFLRRKKEVEKSKKPAKRADKLKVNKKSATPEKQILKETQKPREYAKSLQNFSFEAVKQPHISEKATYLSEKNQYIFKVLPNYNKKEIKNAVEGLYGVDVLSVKVVKIPSKKRRIGRTQGFKKGYKKAIVKIKEGQKIEVL